MIKTYFIRHPGEDGECRYIQGNDPQVLKVVQAIKTQLAARDEVIGDLLNTLDRIGFGPYPMGIIKGWYAQAAREVLSKHAEKLREWGLE